MSGRPVRISIIANGRQARAEGWLTSNHGVELMTLEALVQRQFGTGLDPSRGPL